MAQTEILKETTYDGFAPNEMFDGVPALVFGSPPCEVEIGKTYVVVWDGVEYVCIAVDMGVDPNLGQAIALGNTNLVGAPNGSNNDAPFILGFTASVSYFISISSETTHTVGIYQETEEEPPEEEPPDGLVLKDRDGNPVTYVGVVGVKMLNTNGELVEFMPKEEAEGGGSSDAPYITYTLDDTGEIVGAAMHGFTSVPASCFYNYTALTTVDFSDCPNLTAIGDNAFYGCSAISSFTVPDGVVSIGENAFSHCTSLTDISLPSGLTSLGSGCFQYCILLPRVTIPEHITSIPAALFENCNILTEVEFLGKVERFVGSAFRYCKALTSFTIPESVTYIGASTFAYCTALTSISIPDSVTQIGMYAFQGCTGLASVTIGSNVIEISQYAFQNCTALTSATFKTTSGWWVSTSYTATSGTSVTVTNTSTAANYLKTTYVKYIWRRT